jgi:hypothetical protein
MSNLHNMWRDTCKWQIWLSWTTMNRTSQIAIKSVFGLLKLSAEQPLSWNLFLALRFMCWGKIIGIPMQLILVQNTDN